MNLLKKMSSAIITLGMATSISAQADYLPFPAAGTDTTYSLGQFSIKVNNSVATSSDFLGTSANHYNDGLLALFQSDGFTWNPGADTLKSPVLFDNNTQIYHGTPYTIGSGSHPNTVDTQIVQFDMHTDNQNVQLLAGSSAVNLPGDTYSNGIVKSVNKTLGGFPANSSFNVYVEAKIAGLPGYLYNPAGSPLKIFSTISAFPPTVAYLHNPSSVTAVDWYNPYTGNSLTVGNIVLAGHSVEPVPAVPYTTLAAFKADPSYGTVASNLASATPEPEQWALLIAGFPLIGWAARRKQTLVATV